PMDELDPEAIERGCAPGRPGVELSVHRSRNLLTMTSECVGAALAGAHPHQLVDGHAPDLAVADLPGLGRGLDDVDDTIGLIGVDEDLDARLGDEVDRVLGAAVHLGLAALAAEAAH